MLINKWLVIDSFNDTLCSDWKYGFCLELPFELGDMSELYLALQQLPGKNHFAILLSEKNFLPQRMNDSYIESIISLFFQPSYFMDSDIPVVFLSSKVKDHTRFIERLSEKCLKQGFPVLTFRMHGTDGPENYGNHVYEIVSSDTDYEPIVKNWLSQYLEDKDPGDIHFLFKKNEPDLTRILNQMQEKEIELHKTELYRCAHLIYEKQKLIEGYKKELKEKISIEKDMQIYLDMQKKQTADNIEWYHQEYEILPTWYKRFGHIIKVLMGKRTFRSLFNDNVKKVKD